MGRPPQVLGDRPVHLEDDVHIALLEGGGACRVVGHDLEHEPLDARRLPPVTLERLDHQLDPRRKRDEPIRAGADGSFLEAIVADLLDIFFGDDPPDTRGRRAEIRQEVGPGLLEVEPHPPWVHDLHFADLLLDLFGAPAPVALEGELDVFSGHHVAVVELDALPEHELIDEAVLRHRPRLGQTRRAEAGWHRLHQRVVEGVEHHERDDGPFRVRGVEPAGGQGNVRPPRHASFGCRVERSSPGEKQEREHENLAHSVARK